MIERFSPDSLSVMEFKTQQDYEITERIYADWPLLGEELEDMWNIRFHREFDMTNDRSLFNQAERGLPLYEGKVIHQFDAYFAKPRFWIEEKELRNKNERLGIRAIARNTDSRTLIGAILPPLVGAGNSLLIATYETLLPFQSQITFYLSGVINSFILDSILRLKVAANINMFYLYQLPLPRLPPGNPYFDAIVPRAARLTCTTSDFADLWQEVMGEEWDETKGATDSAERQRLRDEIDALVAHLYGLSRGDFEHILGTFPLVFPEDEAGHRKKERLLGVYDAYTDFLA